MNLGNTLTAKERKFQLNTIQYLPSPTTSYLKQRWTTQTPFGEKPDYWNQRLTSEGFTREEFLAVVKQPNWNNYNVEIVGEWYPVFQQIIHEYNTNTSDYFTSSYPTASYLNAFAGFVAYFEQQLNQWLTSKNIHPKLINQHTLLAAISQQFKARLFDLINKTVAIEQKIFFADHPQFDNNLRAFADQLRTTNYQKYLFEEYPALTRVVTEETIRWLNYVREVLQHFMTDYTALKELLLSDKSILEKIEMGKGDRHVNGKSVAILYFNNNQKLVYKPRSLQLQVKFQKLIKCMNLDVHPNLKILSRTDYGWMEFVEHTPCKGESEVQVFYHRSGSLLALLYILNASDMHAENIIAHGSYPTLIDLECIFHPVFKQSNAPSTVLQTGTLPIHLQSNNQTHDFQQAGLGAATAQMKSATNLPLLHGKTVTPAKYVAEIVAGFRETYEFILTRQTDFLQAIASFRSANTRILFRNTSVYGKLLNASYHPKIWCNQLERERHFDWLWAALPENEQLAEIIPLEKAALQREDIPVFHCQIDGCSIKAENKKISDFFGKSGYTAVVEKVKQLSSEDANRQIWLIKSTLGTVATTSNNYFTKQPIRDASSAIGLAEQIGDKLIKAAFVSDNTVEWIQPADTNLEGDRKILSTLDTDLFHGLSGIALTLAYLQQVTQKDKYYQLAERTLHTIISKVDKEIVNFPSLGAFGGWGGIFYTVTHLAKLWQRPQLFEWIENQLQQKLFEELIVNDHQRTVIYGSAGFILALKPYYEITQSQRALQLMQLAGMRLLNTAQEMPQGMGWKVFSKSPLSGLAHGAAGFAYALATLYQLTCEEKYLEATKQALIYENSLFVPQQSNWEDRRDFVLQRQKDTFCALGWSHGAPGIGLVRIQLLKKGILPSESLLQDIQRAQKATITGLSPSNLSLSMGEMGNLELLLQLTISGRTNSSEQSVFEYLPNELVARLNHQTSYGLMTGIAGVAYQLIRLARPTKVPSVLLLESPY